MRKFTSGNSTPSKAAAESILGAPVTDSQVVGNINGQPVTAGDVRKAEEFGLYMDDLTALYNHVREHPDDKEAMERLTLNVQYLQKHHLFEFLEVAFTLWQVYRSMTKDN